MILTERIIIFEKKIKDEKIRYDLNNVIAKLYALSSGEIDKHEYLTGKELKPTDHEFHMWLGDILPKQFRQFHLASKKMERNLCISEA